MPVESTAYVWVVYCCCCMAYSSCVVTTCFGLVYVHALCVSTSKNTLHLCVCVSILCICRANETNLFIRKLYLLIIYEKLHAYYLTIWAYMYTCNCNKDWTLPSSKMFHYFRFLYIFIYEAMYITRAFVLPLNRRTHGS